MEKLTIHGGKPLSGKVQASGAKNAVLPLMAVSILTGGEYCFNNVPFLNDIKMMAHLLRIIGAKVDYENQTLRINSAACSYYEAPYELVSKMRASIYVLSPLLVRFGKARVSLPGGCAIGARPIDLHLKALEKMGVSIRIEHGYINASVKQLYGADIFFDKSSVGATVTVLMAAVKAKGETRITNAALEPEVISVIEYLQAMGADIKGKGTSELLVKGVSSLNPSDTTVIPDRIEAGTFLVAGAITGGDVTVSKCIPQHLAGLTGKLIEAGCVIEKGEGWIRVKAAKKLSSVNITTKPYPGFPTDLQAQFMSLMTLAQGTSVIEETIFAERFHHVPELRRLHADVTLENDRAIVKGVDLLSGAEVMATDLRASAALVLAGLAAQGETTISRIYHLDRGYERMEKKLAALGAVIRREVN
jgi:UDP-N-acetylglucosamine 1-carboxyvinyltransferase